MAASTVPDDVFHGFRAGKTDPARREHLIILMAVEEMILERKQQQSSSDASAVRARPSPNEYFAAFMTALEAKDQSHTPELVCLLDAVLGHVEKSILRSKFKSISAVLVTLLKTNLDHEMTAFVRDLVACLGKLLLAQEVATGVWSSPQTIKTFYVLLSCFREKRPKVRKAAMTATIDLLRLHANRKVWALAKQVADFSINVLAACTASDCLPTLHLLRFLQEGLPLLTQDAVVKLCERMLRLQSLESNLVVQSSLQTLKALLKTEAAPVTSDFVVQLTEGVLDLQPSHGEKDVEVSRAFCEVVAACLDRLSASPGGDGAHKSRVLLPRAMQALVARCETESPLVHEAACFAMRQCLAACVAEDVRTLSSEDLKLVTNALAAASKLLEYRYQRSWATGLPFLGSLFIHFKGDSGGTLLDSLLRKLALLHDAVVTSAPELVKPFENCIALAVECLGIEKVLEVLPLEDEKQGGVVGSRWAWLLPLLASHGKRRPCHLQYFQSHILELARKSNELVTSPKLSLKQQQQQRQRVLQLWALLPAFCAQPLDIASSFGDLAAALANALQDPNNQYPELLFTVCQSLQALIKSVQDSDKEDDLQTLSTLSKKFLPVLFNVLDNTPLEDSATGVKVRVLSDTISTYALIAPKAFVGSLFKKLVQKMLKATQGTDEDMDVGNSPHSSNKAVVLCELALALVPSLDEAGIRLLYKVIRPLIRLDKDIALQKRAYRVLGALCEHQGDIFLTPDTLQDLVPVLTDSLLACHVSARQMRLRVLGAVVGKLDGANPEHWELLAGLVGEVLLCLKDANGKAREAAYHVLSIMAQVKKDEEDLNEFCQVVLAALAAETPHMRSAAVLALAHLIFEYAPKSPAFRATIPDLLETVLLLGSDPVKEVVKAVVSFIRICVAACPLDGMQPLLPAIIGCLFASNSKVKFRAKIKIILKKLCRKFGYDHILALAPETDKKLIHHIQKQALRGDRISSSVAAAAAAAGRVPGGLEEADEEGHVRRFESMLGDDEDDSSDEDDGEDDDDNHMDEHGPLHRKRIPTRGAAERHKGKRKAEEMLVRGSSSGGGIIDLLDASMIENLKLKGSNSAGASQKKRGRDEDSDDDEVLEFNEKGKLVVREPIASDDDEDDEDGGMPKTPSWMDLEEDAVESDDEKDWRTKRQKRADGSSAPGGNGRVGKNGAGKGKNGSKLHTPGGAYKSKKAGGDVKRKGQLEPYAYIPLNPKMHSKRMKGEAHKTFDSVLGANKKQRRQERKQDRTRKGGRK